jgi:GxxExxY protein
MKNNIDEKILSEICNKIYDELGPYYQEATYQSAMEYELNKQEIRYRREMRVPIYYDKIIIAHGVVDFWIAPNILVEFKAKKDASIIDENQVKRYLKSLNIPFGFLINFNNRQTKLKIDKINNPNYNSEESPIIKNNTYSSKFGSPNNNYTIRVPRSNPYHAKQRCTVITKKGEHQEVDLQVLAGEDNRFRYYEFKRVRI